MLAKSQIDATILVVEDEEIVRSLTRRILTRSGFRVLEAANSQRALEICRTEKFELLLTDVIMPGMTGNELVDVVTKSKPDMKVIFMSGYTAGLLNQQASRPFIQKPFTPNDLINKINQVLVGLHV